MHNKTSVHFFNIFIIIYFLETMQRILPSSLPTMLQVYYKINKYLKVITHKDAMNALLHLLGSLEIKLALTPLLFVQLAFIGIHLHSKYCFKVIFHKAMSTLHFELLTMQ